MQAQNFKNIWEAFEVAEKTVTRENAEIEIKKLRRVVIDTFCEEEKIWEAERQHLLDTIGG